MKRTWMILVLLALGSAAHAQTFLTQTRTAGGPSGFTIGPRYSNYATDIDLGVVTLDTGRQSAIGLEGEYRSGVFVLDFMADHDPENGVSLADLLPLDLANYERDRGELTIGYAGLPFLDLQGGVRADSITIGGAFAGLFSGIEVDHQALVAGVRLHSPNMRPFGVYGLARGYFGTANSDDLGIRVNADTTGYRAEGGLHIPIGTTNWVVIPALEYEHLEAKDIGLQLDTNRLMINFVYSMGH